MKAICYGDNIDTDVIIAARYLNFTDGKELAKHCMEDLDPTFSLRVEKNDVLVAGKNFGCGSSREHAPLALKCAGISLVIAKNFARIFYRNAINIGLPILECEEAAKDIEEGNEISFNLTEGIIKNLTKNKCYRAEPFPKQICAMIEAGGLLKFIVGGSDEICSTK